MYIYIITFLFSLLFIYLGLRFKSNKVLSIIFTTIGILIPCLLAALRDYSIGTDVKVYQIPYFDKSGTYPNLFNFIFDLSFHNVYLASKEVFYLILAWISSNIFHSIQVFLFLTQLLIIVPIYISLKKVSKTNLGIMLGMFIYFTYFYNLTYNMARQSIALAFTVLVFSYLGEKDYKKAILFTIVSIFFHNTALILLPIIFLYYVLGKKMPEKKKLIIQISIFVVLLLLAIFLVPLLSWLGSTFNLKYGSYATVWLKKGGSIIGKAVLLKALFLIGFTYYYRDNFKKITKNYAYYFYILFIFLLSSYTNALIEHSNRIYFYLMYPYIMLLIPRLPDTFKSKKVKYIMISAIIIIFSAYWLYYYCYLGYNHTVPYIFKKFK